MADLPSVGKAVKETGVGASRPVSRSVVNITSFPFTCSTVSLNKAKKEEREILSVFLSLV